MPPDDRAPSAFVQEVLSNPDLDILVEGFRSRLFASSIARRIFPIEQLPEVTKILFMPEEPKSIPTTLWERLDTFEL